MTAPTIMINYQNVVQLIQHFEQQQVQVQAMHERLERQFEVLYGGAWRGGEAADKFYRELTLIMEGVTRLSRACGTAGGTVKHIAQIFNKAEEAGRDAIPGAVGETQSAAPGFWGSNTQKNLNNSLFGPNGPLANTEYGYGGVNTFWKNKQGLGIDGEPVLHTPGNVVSAGATLWEKMFADGSFKRGQITGENGNLQFDALNGSASASGGVDYSGGKLEAGLRAELGVYMARMRGNLKYDSDYGALAATADAMVGARAAADAKVTFDPKTMNVSAKGSAELFAGAMVEGTGGWQSDYLSVEGQISGTAGAGAKAEGEFGFKDGTFTVSGKALGSLGLGFGAGVKVSVNIYNIWDAASGAVSDAMTAVTDW